MKEVITMKKVHKMTIAGLNRELPLCPINDKLDIAAFIMFSDVELTVASAEELLKIVPDFDVLLTAETKGIPLAYEMARQSGKPYVAARKSVKLYMQNPVFVTVKSITTEGVQTLYLSEDDANMLKGRRVLIVDDVISTGESLSALEALCSKVDAPVCGKAAVLAEGDAAKSTEKVFLEELPLFYKE